MYGCITVCISAGRSTDPGGGAQERARRGGEQAVSGGGGSLCDAGRALSAEGLLWEVSLGRAEGGGAWMYFHNYITFVQYICTSI